MDDIPDEVLLEVFNYLDSKLLKNVMFVCKRWQRIITQSASTMKLLPLSYTHAAKSDEINGQLYNFHTLIVRHMDKIIFSESLLEQGLGSSIQHLEISYCSLNSSNIHMISNRFINLNSLTLTKVKFEKDSDIIQGDNSYKLPILNKLILLKVDHEILDHLTVQTRELEITDSNENSRNEISLLKFVTNQTHLISLTFGEMSNHSSVFFHHKPTVNYNFKLKKFHPIYCSNHSNFPQFEENFLSFLRNQSGSLEEVKLSGRFLPSITNKYVISSLTNLKSLEIEAGCIPQETAFYEGISKKCNNFKSLCVTSTITKINFLGLKDLLCHNQNITKLDLMDTDETVPNDLFYYISRFLLNLKELSVLNFSKSFSPQFKINSLESFSVKIVTNLDQLNKFTAIHNDTLNSLTIWWITRDFQSVKIDEIISLPYLNHLKVGGRFIANKRIYEVVKNDSKKLKSLHLIVNNYDEVKHLKFTFPSDKNLCIGLKCSYFEEYHDREPLND